MMSVFSNSICHRIGGFKWRGGVLTLLLVSFFLWPFRAKAEVVTTEDVIAKTLENNVQIQMAISNYQISVAEEKAAMTDFDINLTVNPAFKKSVSLPNTTLDLDAVEETTSSASLGLKKKFQFGTTGELVYQELLVSTNSQLATLQDSSRSALQVKLTQPLLRQASSSVTTSLLQKARLKRQKHWFELLSTVDKELLEAQTAFWELHQSAHQIRVDQETVTLARENLLAVETRHNGGYATHVDVEQFKAKLALAEASLLSTQFQFESRQERLQKSMGPLNDSASLTLEPKPRDRVPAFSDFSQADVNLASLPAYRKAGLEILESQVEVTRTRNGLWPQLDLGLKYSFSGLGADMNAARDQITRSQHPSWQVMLSFSYPLENLFAKGEHQQSLAIAASKENLQKKEEILFIDRFNDSVRELKKKAEILSSMSQRLQTEEELFRIKRQAFQKGAYAWDDYSKAIDSFNDLKSSMQEQITSVNIENLKLLSISGRLATQEIFTYLSHKGLAISDRPSEP